MLEETTQAVRMRKHQTRSSASIICETARAKAFLAAHVYYSPMVLTWHRAGYE